MITRVPVLHSKLMVPRTTDTIVREKLKGLIFEIPRKKIITVTAPAGYGKTILVSQAVQDHDTVWYRLDGLDRDFATFMHHLVEGARRIYPGFAAEVLDRLEEGQTLGHEYKGIVTLFVHELGKALTKEMMIVLDDYHTVQDSPMIRDSVQLLCDHLGGRAHLIVISRSEIALQLSRLRSMREVLDINADDLLFTAGETRQLFTQFFGITLPDEPLELLYKKTSGWVSALILFFHSIRGKDHMDMEQEILKLKGSGRFISEYLAENVYASLHDGLKRFLKMTSILPRLNSELCNRIAGTTNAADILRDLQKSHLFTFALDDEGREYCYHQLFLEFLQGVLKREMEPMEKTRLHCHAARILEMDGDDEEAVQNYLMAGEYEQACRVLERISPALIALSRMELVHECLGKIPEEFFNMHPWIEYLRAIAHIFSGRAVEARNSLMKASSVFTEKDDKKGTAVCLNTMAINLYLKGDLHQAEQMYKKLLGSDSLEPDLRVEVLIHLVFITSQYGHMEESDEHYGLALSLMKDIEDATLREMYLCWLMLYHGFRHSISGNHHKAIALAEAAQEKLQAIGSYRLMTLACQVKSLACIYTSSHAQGLEEARKGILISKEKGFRDITYAWLHCIAGAHIIWTGKIEEALHYAQEGLRHFQELGSPFGEAFAYYVMGNIYLIMGNLDLAEEMEHTGLKAADGLDLPHITGPIKGLLAYILVFRNRLDEAETLLREANATFPYSLQFRSWVLGVDARIHWLKGRKEEAVSLLHESLKLAEAHNFISWLAIDWVWLLPMLMELYAQKMMQPFIEEIFIIAGDAARTALQNIQKSAEDAVSQTAADILKAIPQTVQPGLKVSCLGKFRVMKDGNEIPSEQWKSRKAKMLFKLLVHLRSRGFVSKEVFMERLWPEEDPAKTAKRFHVALTTLRRILEPDMERGQASAYLKSEGDTYLLDLGRDGLVDVEAFEEACAMAGSAPDETLSIKSLLDADRLYTGEFLEEDLYEPWCIEERERLKNLHLSALASIIEYFMHHRELETAIKYCHSYLAIDAYAEDIYQNLLKLYALTGNRPMVLKTYERGKERIVNDLGCPLSRQTEMLAEDLLRE